MANQERQRVQVALESLWQTLDNSGHPMPVAKGRAYTFALAQLTVDQIEEACRRAMVSCKFFPKPVELIELICGSMDQQAEAAWQLVLKAMQEQSAYRSVAFQDPRISRAIASNGGWVNFCERPITWSKKDFVASFKQQRPDCNPVDLVGIFDEENQTHAPRLVHESETRKVGFDGPKQIAAVRSELPR